MALWARQLLFLVRDSFTCAGKSSLPSDCCYSLAIVWFKGDTDVHHDCGHSLGLLCFCVVGGWLMHPLVLGVDRRSNMLP